jgi:hypothetical protein
MGTAYDNEESMTHEEILLRVKAIFRRDMTPEERRGFFLRESPVEPNAEKP